MDTNSKREEIIRRLNQFREDPELRDFLECGTFLPQVSLFENKHFFERLTN